MSDIHDLGCFNCIDCSKSTLNEYYMVHDELWKIADMELHGGMLCIGCLEERIGRELDALDFTDCPLNNEADVDRSERLKNRLKPPFQTSISAD